MKDILLQLFQARSFPVLAAAVRRAAPRILEEWEKNLRELIPEADELTWVELRNSLPQTMERLAVALESTRPAPTRDLMVDAADHGACRFHQTFNLSELLVEYSLLRSVTVREVQRALQRDLTLDETLTLVAGLDLGSRRSIITFVEHQKRELQEATELQAQYLSFLAHDLRGGLNSILLLAEVLREDLASEPRLAPHLADLETMRRNAYDTISAMNRLLQAEKLRTGAVQPRLVETDLRSLVQGIARQFHQEACAKNLRLAVEVDDSVRCRTDKELVLLILQNLVSNAVKYSSQGTVEVSGRQLDENRVQLTVADEGPGIAKERLATLFSPYTRGDTHGRPGVGLGLFIAHLAARVVGASLSVETECGKGTRFHVNLPA